MKISDRASAKINFGQEWTTLTFPKDFRTNPVRRRLLALLHIVFNNSFKEGHYAFSVTDGNPVFWFKVPPKSLDSEQRELALKQAEQALRTDLDKMV